MRHAYRVDLVGVSKRVDRLLPQHTDLHTRVRTHIGIRCEHIRVLHGGARRIRFHHITEHWVETRHVMSPDCLKRTCALRLLCVTMTPFGSDVLPEVYCRNAISSGSQSGSTSSVVCMYDRRTCPPIHPPTYKHAHTGTQRTPISHQPLYYEPMNVITA